MTIEISGVNADSGLELCDGDLTIYLRSLHLYVSSVPVTLEKMRNVSAETLRNYSVNAHGIKSISEYIGAEEARKTAKELEAMAKNGDLAGVLAQNESFIKYAGNLVDNIQNWLKKNNISGI
ncbi:MAG: hypothetical protein FWD36_05540 [Treponema sp.]|nr:hypothetical protein [Treponema sp.]